MDSVDKFDEENKQIISNAQKMDDEQRVREFSKTSEDMAALRWSNYFGQESGRKRAKKH